MQRSEFLKNLGLGASGLIIPSNSFIADKNVKIYDNYIKGLPHYDYTKVASKLKEGDVLLLKRDIKNIHDSFAIAVYYQNYKLGYIPAYENVVLANMLDAGVALKAFISKHQKNESIYEALAVSIEAQLIVPSEKLITLIQTESRADDAKDLYRHGPY